MDFIKDFTIVAVGLVSIAVVVFTFTALPVLILARELESLIRMHIGG